MSRITYVDEDDLPEEKQDLLVSSVPKAEIAEEYRHLMEGQTRNSYRAIAHHPRVLEYYRKLVDAIKADSGLSTLEQEIVILTGAREIDSRYEWHNHVRIALDAGVSEDTIRAIGAKDFDGFEPEHAALMRYVVRFMHGTVDDELHRELSTHYDDATIVGIALFAGYWLMNARVIHALDIDTEEEFVGWNLENI